MTKKSGNEDKHKSLTEGIFDYDEFPLTPEEKTRRKLTNAQIPVGIGLLAAVFGTGVFAMSGDGSDKISIVEKLFEAPSTLSDQAKVILGCLGVIIVGTAIALVALQAAKPSDKVNNPKGNQLILPNQEHAKTD